MQEHTNEHCREISRLEQTEKKFRDLFENVPDALALINEAGQFVLLNRQMEGLFGYERQELLDANMSVLIPERLRAKQQENLRNFFAAYRTRPLCSSFESRGRKKSGDEFPVDIRFSPFETEEKVFVLVDIRDISEQKRAQAALRESEEKYRTLVENVNFGIFRNTGEPHGRFLQVNSALVKMFGFDSAAELLQVEVADLYQCPEDRRLYVEELLQKGFIKDKELQLKKRDGTPIWTSTTAKAQLDENGAIAWIDGVVEDITIRKWAEEALRQSEERYRELVEGTDNLVVQVARDGRINFVNKTAVRLFGLSAHECVGKTFFYFVHPDDREATREALQSWIAKKIPSATFENRLISRAGEARDILWTTNLHFDAGGQVATVNSVGRDITSRKRAEERIKRSYYFENTLNSVLKIALKDLPFTEQLERTLDLILAIPFLALHAKGCIFLVEADPEVLVMKVARGLDEEVMRNCARVPFGRRLCGKAAATCKVVFADRLEDEHEPHFENLMPHGQYCIPICHGEKVYGVLSLLLKEGHRRDEQEEEFLLSIANTLASLIVQQQMEQEQERLQAQLIQAEKLSALGRMTASVAHEIRNPLTAIGGLAKRLDRQLPEGTKEKEYSRVIASESFRLEKILKSILAYTREGELHRERCNINDVINEALAVFEVAFKERAITLQKSLAELPDLTIDITQVREVVDNIIRNAADSLTGGGSITVATGLRQVDGDTYVTIEITDTGKGIEQDKLGRIFEPFYTTKAVGRGDGVGLGLPISKKIMERHGGFIRAASVVGQGTTFSIFFPLEGGKTR